MPIQQMLLGVGAVATKTYVDDVFSTFLYKGNNGNTLNINNGIDLTGEGGMTWIKCRDTGSTNHSIYDTVRGASELLWANSNAAQMDQTGCGSNKALYQFNNNGFTLGGDCNGTENWDQKAFSSWTFRKAKGFFDVVTYTGNGSNRTISHSLGSVPGCIMIKATDATTDWYVWHKGLEDPKLNRLKLNTNATQAQNVTYWNQTLPTSTNFSLGTYGDTNGSGTEYVAYVFAGGESTNALARSVKFDGSDDYIRTPDHSDLDLDTNQFTIEMWVKSSTNPTSGNMNLVGQWGGNDKGYAVRYSLAEESFDGWGFQYCTNEQGTDINTINGSTGIADGQWHHLAVVRESSTIKLYTDGILSSSTSISGSLHITNSERDFYVGSDDSDKRYTGNVSNVRVIVGTALYTSSFSPPTEPLTNVTNTKLLCCNNSSVTGSTVSPGTFYSGGGPTASTDSPFDDPAGFDFGDAGDQNVIKCGSYVGGTLGKEINVGFEPQFVLLKATNYSQNWRMVDMMRGFTAKGIDDKFFNPNQYDAEHTDNRMYPTPKGFGLDATDYAFNGSGGNYIYIAIRRPDGYVGKPPELGTGVFAMDTGNDSSTIPNYDSGFPVDFAFKRYIATSNNWQTSARLMQGKYLDLNDDGAEGTSSGEQYDSNVGYNTDQSPSTVQAWMFKRHAGFDVVTYTGDGTSGRQIPHSLSKTPEMMWVKRRTNGSGGTNWLVSHKGLNGGSSPENYYLLLNGTSAETATTAIWNDTAPTSTHFTVGNNSNMNANDKETIAFLFASVDGISKVGYYTGDGSTDGSNAITVGFQPRFLIIKRTDSTGNWNQFDTVRGLGSGVNTMSLNLNTNDHQSNQGSGKIGLSSTAFIPGSGGEAGWNGNNEKYIYYCHA